LPQPKPDPDRSSLPAAECDEPPLSITEICAAIHEIMNTPDELDRLDGIARYLCSDPSQNFNWKDLRNEAILRALNGKRECPRSVKVMKFLKEAMRSIISDEWSKKKRFVNIERLSSSRRNEDDNDELIDWDIADSRPTPDREAYAFLILRKIRASCADDQAMRVLLDGLRKGLEGEELRSWTGLDETTFASTRRRLRRRIDKLFPGGWRS
jgi:DNA-directed RNA polymerase specialized sigma24 family protein